MMKTGDVGGGDFGILGRLLINVFPLVGVSGFLTPERRFEIWNLEFYPGYS